MLSITDNVVNWLDSTGFERVEIVERDAYPGIEYQIRGAYVFATQPDVQTAHWEVNLLITEGTSFDSAKRWKG